MDFLAEILVTVQGANWQRSGGKGSRPERVARPADVRRGATLDVSSAELAVRRKQLRKRQRKGNGG